MNQSQIVRFGMFAMLLASAAGAATISYTSDSGGYWNEAYNWDLGRVPQAFDNVEIIADNAAYNKIVTYNDPVLGYLNSISIDSTVSTYGMLLQTQYALTTVDMNIATGGTGYHWMEGNSYLWVTDTLNVGYYGSGDGHFYMNVYGSGSGLEVDEYCYVGYHAEADFDHVSGEVLTKQLYIGQNAPGTYWLDGDTTSSHVNVEYSMVVGNGDQGLFEQSGGSVEVGSTTILGLNNGGNGTYEMTDGVLTSDGLVVGWAGIGSFQQSGGTVTITDFIHLGRDYLLDEPITFNIDAGNLDVSAAMKVGQNTLAHYQQSGGSVTIGTDLYIYDHDSNDTESSSVTLTATAGTLEVGEEIHNAGYFHQLGGTVTTPTFTNNSSDGTVLDNSAILQTRTLDNTSGLVLVQGESILRGPLAFPPHTYWLCDFTNDGTFYLGTRRTTGGTFAGNLENNGTFNYYSGDFSTSNLTNNGTFNNYRAFACRHIENNTNITIPGNAPITIDSPYATAFENNGNLVIENQGTLDMNGDSLVNNGNMFAGGPSISPYTMIYGDVVNNGVLVPTADDGKGILKIQGSFTNSTDAELHIRLQGTIPGTGHDQVWATGSATLAGDLIVEAFPGYVPQVNDLYVILAGTPLDGEFDNVTLPTLPNGRYWRVYYYPTTVNLVVKNHPVLPGDCDDDGDVDLDDFEGFGECMMGHHVSVGPECDCYKLDSDPDVDLRDYMIFQQIFTGAQ